MFIRKLAHYAVRTRDLEASRRFYEEVLQLRAGFRPPFAFPGVWLYAGEDESDLGVVHLIGEGNPEALADYLGAQATHPAAATTGDLGHRPISGILESRWC